MHLPVNIVSTIKEKCKVCYTCVRECPAKAISMTGGQAQVLGERCIGCGNCVRICSQKAKVYKYSTDAVKEILSTGQMTAAIIAPSFPAEFTEFDHSKLVAALRALGFSYVIEVGFGADLVAREYKKLVDDNVDKSFIASTCPAIVAFIEKYNPHLIKYLVPIVSPMIATARTVKEMYGNNLKIVFIGPCIAKKFEKERRDLKDSVDEVITFKELRTLFEEKKTDPAKLPDSNFDPPYAAEGSLFSVGRGIFKAADIEDDVLQNNAITAIGRVNSVEAIHGFGAGFQNPTLLEVLSCEGCIMGPGSSSKLPIYKRQYYVSQYAKNRLARLDRIKWKKHISINKKIKLDCVFSDDNQILPLPNDSEITQVLARLGKLKNEDELNCGACGYETCREHASAIICGFAENEMCLPYTIDRLKDTVKKLEHSYVELKSMKETLDHREKLASMGQLAAGIAHEVNNPLGVVLMFAHMLQESTAPDDPKKYDYEMIVEQADRCKKIVSGLLKFARQNKVILEPVNIPEFIQHCVDAMRIPEGIVCDIINKLDDPYAQIDKDQITQVMFNLFNNSIDAIGNSGKIVITLSGDQNNIIFSVADTGCGISPELKKRIFEPFFTTKQLGKGTGLGLPVIYGIVKMHGGDIFVESNNDSSKGQTGTEFKIILPRKGMEKSIEKGM